MKRSPLRYIANLFLGAVIILGVLKLTTFGWWPGSPEGKPVGAVDAALASRLQATVMYLAGSIGVRNTKGSLEETAEFITQELRAMGYEPELMTYSVKGETYQNIVATLTAPKANETILVGAHYDSCFNPGADDNASGVAGVLELARSLKDARIQKNIMFVFFTNEEPPFFRTSAMGSRVFAKEAKAAGMPIKVAVILEMIGYYSQKPFSQRYLPLLGPFFPNQGDFIVFVGDLNSRQALKEMEQSFKASTDMSLRSLAAPGNINGINFSDHASFWREGYPAIMVTDTAYLRNRNYHTDHDLPDTLNYPTMARVVSGLKGAILNWAK